MSAGDVVDIYPVHEEERAVRIHFFGDLVESIHEIDPLTGKAVSELNRVTIYPATHYVTTVEIRERAIRQINEELKERIEFFRSQNKLLEAQRIEERTHFDLEMMIEMGYCHGIENYSRHLTGRAPGEPPPTLLDYFSKGLSWPSSMRATSRSRSSTECTTGIVPEKRPWSSTDFDCPLRWTTGLSNSRNSNQRVKQVIYVSATPGPYELEKAELVTEQIIRPTGLTDPEIIVRPATNQVDDLLGWIRGRVAADERVLVTTLTKSMAEDLTDYYADLGIKVRYLHSDIKTIERMEIIRDLRLGVFDVLVGINLLREGLDLPEVSLVAILDADKEGFLRSERSLIQTCGRAARNIRGQVILYGDQVTGSMARAIEESNRRRQIAVGIQRKAPHHSGLYPESRR